MRSAYTVLVAEAEERRPLGELGREKVLTWLKYFRL
jgi:hypothetical protein